MPWASIISFAMKYWKPLAVSLLVAAIYGAGWIEGAGHINTKWEAEKKTNALAAAEQEKRQAEDQIKVVTVYVDKIKVVHDKGAIINKEVPAYVPPDADADCTIHMGFVRLHDAAATNTIPGPTRDTDAAPAGIALSTVAETLADNYQRCHENIEQIKAWQQWAMAMGATNQWVKP